jgi:hypothetical protein
LVHPGFEVAERLHGARCDKTHTDQEALVSTKQWCQKSLVFGNINHVLKYPNHMHRQVYKFNEALKICYPKRFDSHHRTQYLYPIIQINSFNGKKEEAKAT